jgi:cell division protein FtsI/penicillin-binding protein 2
MMQFLLAALVLSGGVETNSPDDGKTGTSYVAVDVRTRAVIEQKWTDVEAPIPVGSLVKPFTALAYAGAFPEFVCKGSVSGCWLSHGHGRVHFREALAQSCNAYFLNLGRDVDAQTLAVVAAKFGIEAPRMGDAETRIGLGEGWPISPLALVRAYAELSSRGSEPRVKEILDGMELAARRGTASAIGRGALAKTGTAARAGDRGHHSDGFTLVLAPSDSPRVALLVRVRGVTGAEAAKSAARILRELRTGR